MNEPRDILLPKARLQPPQPIGVVERDFREAQAAIRGDDLNLRDPAVRRALVRLIRDG